MNIYGRALLSAAAIPASAVVGLQVRYLLGRRRVAGWYDSAGHPRDDGVRLDPGTVSSLSVLPLVEWYACRNDLDIEPGLSYLVRAGETTILFDLGLGRRPDGQSRLSHNMEVLGVDPHLVDLVVISHPHPDHLRGFGNQIRRTVTSGSGVDSLAGKPVYATASLRVPAGQATVVTAPRVLAPGVATTGPLPVQLFIFGRTLEQALVVNVEGRGIVLVIGCGHPGVESLVERAEQVLQQPVYGVKGMPLSGAGTSGVHLISVGNTPGHRVPPLRPESG